MVQGAKLAKRCVYICIYLPSRLKLVGALPRCSIVASCPSESTIFLKQVYSLKRHSILHADLWIIGKAALVRQVTDPKLHWAGWAGLKRGCNLDLPQKPAKMCVCVSLRVVFPFKPPIFKPILSTGTPKQHQHTHTHQANGAKALCQGVLQPTPAATGPPHLGGEPREVDALVNLSICSIGFYVPVPMFDGLRGGFL